MNDASQDMQQQTIHAHLTSDSSSIFIITQATTPLDSKPLSQISSLSYVPSNNILSDNGDDESAIMGSVLDKLADVQTKVSDVKDKAVAVQKKNEADDMKQKIKKTNKRKRKW